MHIPVLHVPSTCQLRAFPVPFQFHFTATAAYQYIERVRRTSRRLGPGLAGAGACSSWPTVRRPLPVDGLSLYLLRLESLSERTSTAQDYASPTAPAHPGSISSSSSSSRVSSNQPHFPTSCQLPATPMLLPHCAHFLLL